MNDAYSNIALHGGMLSGVGESDGVLGALRGALASLPTATVTAQVGDTVVVYPQPVPFVPDAGRLWAFQLSFATDSTALLADVRPLESLRLQLAERGTTTDEYDAEPGTPFGDDLPPRGGDAALYLVAFGITEAGSTEYLSALLRAGRYDDEFGYTQAGERHEEIASALGLSATAGIGYDDIQRGVLPDGVSRDMLIHLHGDPSRDLAQYTLLMPPPDATDGDIAAYLLPDVVSLGREIEDDEWTGRVPPAREIVARLNASEAFNGEFRVRSEGSFVVVTGDGFDLFVDGGDGEAGATRVVFARTSVETDKADCHKCLIRLAGALNLTVWEGRTQLVWHRPPAG